MNPNLSTVKDVTRVSHQAGMNAIAKGRALSYGSTFASSSLGGLMQSSANKVIQSLGKGSVPAMIVGAGVAKQEANHMDKSFRVILKK
ncbi:hypothetical protein C2R91_05090 [Helicobacter pylori]|nr:hypothetical protein C2R91_05090 [Helicobacter pylori]